MAIGNSDHMTLLTSYKVLEASPGCRYIFQWGGGVEEGDLNREEAFDVQQKTNWISVITPSML